MSERFQLSDAEEDLLALAQRRSLLYADALGITADRILQRAFAQTALSLCWQATDERPLVPAWQRYAAALIKLF